MKLLYEVTGGSLNVSVLKDMLHNSYKKKKEQKNDINGYVLDNDLSGERVKVYHNNNKNHTVVAHRGTNGMQDWITDARLLIGDKTNKRYQHAKDISNKAHEKYQGSKFTQIGHSLAGDIANESKQNNDEVIKYNAPTTPIDILKPQQNNEYRIRTSLDPISVLQPLSPFNKNKNNITIPSNNFNLYDQHKIKQLKHLDKDLMIGK